MTMANYHAPLNDPRLPFEKIGHRDDFVAGYRAGESAFKRNNNIDRTQADRAYLSRSKKHGSWWVDGYVAAIDVGRGVSRGPGVRVAEALGLSRQQRKRPKAKRRAASTERDAKARAQIELEKKRIAALRSKR